MAAGTRRLPARRQGFCGWRLYITNTNNEQTSTKKVYIYPGRGQHWLVLYSRTESSWEQSRSGPSWLLEPEGCLPLYIYIKYSILYVKYAILYHTYSILSSKHLILIFSEKTAFESGLLFLRDTSLFSKLVIFPSFRRKPYTRMCVSTVGSF